MDYAIQSGLIDEALVHVQAGAGGRGCLSFLRTRLRPKGGPDGGDGGDGGSVWLLVDGSLRDLLHFRQRRRFAAEDGRSGGGGCRSGRRGRLVEVRVPPGTRVYDSSTGELLGDMTSVGLRLLVARGGRHGLGNAHFKSSTNRAPRSVTMGIAGEGRDLRLELCLLADAALVGFPNAGKSTLLRAVSAARPRVAAYPFTTLQPELGVVEVDILTRFVLADIPGLIRGAASGMGLGHAFLRHLRRTSLLLHMVDASESSAQDICASLGAVEQELTAYSQELAVRPRWVVLSKLDVLPADEGARLCGAVRTLLPESLPMYGVSGVSGQGCRELMAAVAAHLDASP